MKKAIAILITLVFFLSAAIPFITSGLVADYGDIELDEWESGYFTDVYDLTENDLILKYSIDMSGIDTFGWSVVEVGLREVGAPNIDPNGFGGWMQQIWQNLDGFTDPNAADNDDHFLLVDHGWLSDEQDYDVDESGIIVTAFGSYDSYAFWFDRDGVDEWQDDYWNYKDGITYNTNGVYDVEIIYHAVDATTGTMVATINGENQGFYDPAYQSHDPPERQPVGKSFNCDMTQLQVFYGRGGGGGTVEISDITVIQGECLEVNKEITYAEYGEAPYYCVPVFEEAKWELQITVSNSGTVDLEDFWVYDSIGAKLDLVIQEGVEDKEYIFEDDESPLYFDDGYDHEYFGDTEPVSWALANGKPPKNSGQHPATHIYWNIDNLEIGQTKTLTFTVITAEFKAGPNNKQAFTSPCHHSLNDGAIAVVEYEENEYYNFWSNPVEVSVYYTYEQDEFADSDDDGLYDWEEVDTYDTDPCNWDTDGDSYDDGYEVEHDSDPTDPECYPPSFIDADLIYWTSEDATEYPAYIPDYPNYELELDESVEWFYLNLDEVEINGLPLADGYYGFNLTGYPDEDFIDVYWAGRGVEEPPNANAWQDIMWDIINGDLPMFFIKVDGMDYMLVDGLMEELYGSGTDMPLQLDGDYYLGDYDFEGTIENTCEAWEDVTITITFHRWEYLETVQVPGTNPGPTYSSVLESGEEYRLVASGTYRFASWGEYGIADAAWNYRNAAYAPGGIPGWYQQASTALQVWVDGLAVAWQPTTYNPAHIYTYDVTGNGNSLEFTIYDNNYVDNSGYITVDIYEWI